MMDGCGCGSLALIKYNESSRSQFRHFKSVNAIPANNSKTRQAGHRSNSPEHSIPIQYIVNIGGKIPLELEPWLNQFRHLPPSRMNTIKLPELNVIQNDTWTWNRVDYLRTLPFQLRTQLIMHKENFHLTLDSSSNLERLGPLVSAMYAILPNLPDYSEIIKATNHPPRRTVEQCQRKWLWRFISSAERTKYTVQ